MQVICYNGVFLPAHQPVLGAANRCFRYGDGLFETMKVVQQQLPLANYHFDRLFRGLQLLGIQTDDNCTRDGLSGQVLELCKRNNCAASGRVRLALFRNEQSKAEYLIEAHPLDEKTLEWNSKGWTIDIYPLARKSCDAFANLKSANFLPYVLAGLYAREKGADECLLLNSYNRICDGSKTNLFLIRKGEVHTPALHEGPVDGVMRRLVIDELKQRGWVVHQAEVDEAVLFEAEAVFCTNAVQGIRWVSRFRDKRYDGKEVKQISELLSGLI